MNMKTMKTSDLTGLALDWAVAKAEDALHPIGNVRLIEELGNYWLPICIGGDPDHVGTRVYFSPSRDWAQAGPIIEQCGIHLCPITYNDQPAWQCWLDDRGMSDDAEYGPTPLVAAMRCYVASKLGDTIEIPEELI